LYPKVEGKALTESKSILQKHTTTLTTSFINNQQQIIYGTQNKMSQTLLKDHGIING